MSGIGIGIGTTLRPRGSLYRRLLFAVGEGLAVGQIDEPSASDFYILQGEADFSIDSSGTISFNSLPDYDVQRSYHLKVMSSRGRIYFVTVYVTIFVEGYTWTGNEYFYNDTYFLA